MEKKIGATLFAQNAVVENLLTAGEIITDNLIAGGAVSRNRLFNSGSVNVTGKTEATATVVGSLTWSLTDFKFAPYVATNPLVLSVAKNPLKAEVALTIGSVTGGVKAQLRYNFQYQKAGVWYNFPFAWGYFTIDAAQGLPNDVRGLKIHNGLSGNDWDIWTGLRLVLATIDTGGFTGATVNIMSADIIVEQVSK